MNVVNREDREVMVYFDRGSLLHHMVVHEHDVMKVGCNHKMSSSTHYDAMIYVVFNFFETHPHPRFH